MSEFASDKQAIAECDVCGFQYKLKELRKLTVNRVLTNIKACPECWEEDHPQNELGRYPIRDPEAVRDPRSDSAGYPQSRAIVLQMLPMTATGFVGQVTIEV